MLAPSTAPPSVPDRWKRVAALLAAVVLGLVWTLGYVPGSSYGWDESMHAALPATRMLLDASGALSVAVHDCQLYPPAYAVYLAVVQALFGLGEDVMRLGTRWLFALGLFLVFLAASGIARGESSRVRGALPLVAMAAGALCPLAFAFSGTLFLEVPFLVAEVLALVLWSARRRAGLERVRLWDLATGAALALCVFVKFNYGLLFVAALGLDHGVEGVRAWRVGSGRAFLARTLWLAAPLVLALAWWFVLPLPGGLELGRAHRENLLSFLEGNRGRPRTPDARRVQEWGAYFVPTLRFGLVLTGGVLLSLARLSNPGVRTAWIVLLGLGIPIAAHPFHLERFLIPLGPPIWLLAATGAGVVLSRIERPSLRLATGLLVLALALCFPERDARFLAKRTGLWNESAAAYQTWLFAQWRDLSPGRDLPTSGLSRETSDELVRLVADEVRDLPRGGGDGSRIGWIGISSELSPAALHLKLLERAGDRERFLTDASRQLFIEFRDTDPGWSRETLERWARQFAIVFHTDPPDLKARGARAWTRRYADRLVDGAGWKRQALGTVRVRKPLQDPIEVTLYACRPDR